MLGIDSDGSRRIRPAQVSCRVGPVLPEPDDEEPIQELPITNRSAPMACGPNVDQATLTAGMTWSPVKGIMPGEACSAKYVVCEVRLVTLLLVVRPYRPRCWVQRRVRDHPWGAIPGLALCVLLQASLLPLTDRGGQDTKLYLYAGLAFLAGFNERWAQDMLVRPRPGACPAPTTLKARRACPPRDFGMSISIPTVSLV
jgi:hypothetical protein